MFPSTSFNVTITTPFSTDSMVKLVFIIFATIATSSNVYSSPRIVNDTSSDGNLPVVNINSPILSSTLTSLTSPTSVETGKVNLGSTPKLLVSSPLQLVVKLAMIVWFCVV